MGIGDSQVPNGAGHPLLCGREAVYRTASGKTMGQEWLLARVSDPGYNIPTYLGEMGQRVGREDFLELSGV